MIHPSACHDSKLAKFSGLVFSHLEDPITHFGFAILEDSAFVARNINGEIIRSGENTETDNILHATPLEVADHLIQINMPSERQSAKWRRRELKAPLGILRLFLTTDAKK